MMKINHQKYVNMMPIGEWLNGKELQTLWKVKPNFRKSWVNRMYQLGLVERRGVTTKVQYKRIAKGARQEKEVTTETTALNMLINAASKVGTENKIMRRALEQAKATIEKALEDIK